MSSFKQCPVRSISARRPTHQTVWHWKSVAHAGWCNGASTGNYSETREMLKGSRRKLIVTQENMQQDTRSLKLTPRFIFPDKCVCGVSTAEASSPSQLNFKTSKHSKIELENLEWEIRKLSMVSMLKISTQKVLLSSGQFSCNHWAGTMNSSITMLWSLSLSFDFLNIYLKFLPMPPASLKIPIYARRSLFFFRRLEITEKGVVSSYLSFLIWDSFLKTMWRQD